MYVESKSIEDTPLDLSTKLYKALDAWKLFLSVFMDLHKVFNAIIRPYLVELDWMNYERGT